MGYLRNGSAKRVGDRACMWPKDYATFEDALAAVTAYYAGMNESEEHAYTVRECCMGWTTLYGSMHNPVCPRGDRVILVQWDYLKSGWFTDYARWVYRGE